MPLKQQQKRTFVLIWILILARRSAIGDEKSAIRERAGSGVPDIFSVWNDEGWVAPAVEEFYQPDRTVLTLGFSKKQAASGKSKRQAEKASGKRKKQAENRRKANGERTGKTSFLTF